MCGVPAARRFLAAFIAIHSHSNSGDVSDLEHVCTHPLVPDYPRARVSKHRVRKKVFGPKVLTSYAERSKAICSERLERKPFLRPALHLSSAQLDYHPVPERGPAACSRLVPGPNRQLRFYRLVKLKGAVDDPPLT